ncbi:cell growth regulator with EF hand domain protein 1 isoform X3 [Betta splendens]|uniref:Cell growth regulator with EF hand domain protein 1 isoform X3 n=1 Tax=Betta splendens TaxID=158456 RepID=A0A6P7M1Q0_BETSP|nr:cell growth regulator with EF hand domain protein 1 isoform X3 [Betta splendens]
MRTGVFMEALSGKLAPCVLCLFLLTNLCRAAPGGTQREEADAQPPSAALPNPFGTGEEDHRLLQSYIQSSLKDGGPEISTWEQEVFFLLGLYDFDRSGLLDGLEMMKLLSDYHSHHAPGAQVDEQVVSMVDFLLQTQDLNQDGLLAPSELLSPALPHTQQDSSNNNAPHAEQEVAAEETLSHPGADEGKAGAQEQREEAHAEAQPHEEEQPRREDKPEEEEAAKEADAQTEREQSLGVAVHQGQPEI